MEESPAKKGGIKSDEKYSDNYSDESEDERFMDINDLKRRREEREAKEKSAAKGKKPKAPSDDGCGAYQEDNYEDDFYWLNENGINGKINRI